MKSILLTTGILAATVLPSAGSAVPVIYDDRAAFIESVNPNASEDFENATPGASFENQPLTVGQFRFVGGSASNLALINRIHPGSGCASITVDGSQFACGFAERAVPLRIDFLSPITAWGADIRGIGNEGRQTTLSLFDEEDNLLSETLFEGNGPFDLSFFGVDLMGQVASYVRFDFLGIEAVGDELDAFAIDNIAFSIDRGTETPSPVPLPAGFVFLLTALGGLGVRKVFS